MDLGTSGAKAAVVDADGRVLSTGQTKIETLLLPDGGAEQDPEAVWHAVVTASQQATQNVPQEGTIIGVSCTGQYSSIIPVDANGAATMNMVVWMDKRGAPIALRKLPGGSSMVAGLWEQLRFVRIHGIPPLDAGTDSLAHMRWIKLARPEVYERTTTFLEPLDYLALRLTGRAATNPCSALMMLLVDNRNLREPRYAPELVRRSEIDPGKLPELLPVDEDVGTVSARAASELGIPEGARVFAPVNDLQAGAVGAYALSGSHAGISVGTTSVMATHVGFKRTDIRNSMVTIPSPVPGGYLLLGENGIGGRTIEYFLEKLVFATDDFADHGIEARFEALERAVAEVEPGSGGVIFLPWLAGSMAPAEDGRVRGGFLNMSLETTRAHLGHAVLEGVALNFRWLHRAAERFVKHRIAHLVFYGGGAVSDLWSQIFADVLQLPIHQVADPRFAVCRGVALLGFSHAGLFSLDEVEDRVPIKRIYEPNADLAARYDLIFSQFVLAFRRNRSIFRALNA
ncbi:MAG: FGGY-family carbohydrate kinase [Deltaproteobacteria bacterium]|nr:FGGY-family carbohydrate kinase [Deltaproteobacteria bacterium]